MRDTATATTFLTNFIKISPEKASMNDVSYWPIAVMQDVG
jgi:hypothetical protein